ncbi:MAG TPA: 4-vinyl reductase [Thermodesulfobacteriota bacterium]|nr:4-vinyl reductase [Thermodesulfobacteriota bacterium]
MVPDWRNAITREGSRITLSGLHVAMHCHHYNINLQKMLEDHLGEQGVELMVRSAEEACYAGFKSLFGQLDELRTIKSKLELFASHFQSCGLGLIDFEKISSKGGTISSVSSHHVTGWLAKHGRRKNPGCHFARGWIAGVLEVIYNRPLNYYLVEEESCKMAGDPQCLFKISER